MIFLSVTICDWHRQINKDALFVVNINFQKMLPSHWQVSNKNPIFIHGCKRPDSNRRTSHSLHPFMLP